MAKRIGNIKDKFKLKKKRKSKYRYFNKFLRRRKAGSKNILLVPYAFRTRRVNYIRELRRLRKANRRNLYKKVHLRVASKWRRFKYIHGYRPKRWRRKPGLLYPMRYIPKKRFSTKEESYSSFLRRYRAVKNKVLDLRLKKSTHYLKLESSLIGLVVGILIKKGKKNLAVKIFKSVLRKLALSKFYARSKYRSPLHLLFHSIYKASPRIILKSKRVGGVIYRLPVFIEGRRRSNSFGFRWIVASAQRRPEKYIDQRITNELIDVLNRRGLTVRRRIDMYRIGLGNKAFIRFLWHKKKRRRKLIRRINRN